MKEELYQWLVLMIQIVLIANFLSVLNQLPHLDRQYTVFGKVVKGMEFVDLIKKGTGANGAVSRSGQNYNFIIRIISKNS